jgi:hypothetical protein
MATPIKACGLINHRLGDSTDASDHSCTPGETGPCWLMSTCINQHRRGIVSEPKGLGAGAARTIAGSD